MANDPEITGINALEPIVAGLKVPESVELGEIQVTEEHFGTIIKAASPALLARFYEKSESALVEVDDLSFDIDQNRIGVSIVRVKNAPIVKDVSINILFRNQDDKLKTKIRARGTAADSVLQAGIAGNKFDKNWGVNDTIVGVLREQLGAGYEESEIEMQIIPSTGDEKGKVRITASNPNYRKNSGPYAETGGGRKEKSIGVEKLFTGEEIARMRKESPEKISLTAMASQYNYNKHRELANHRHYTPEEKALAETYNQILEIFEERYEGEYGVTTLLIGPLSGKSPAGKHNAKQVASMIEWDARHYFTGDEKRRKGVEAIRREWYRNKSKDQKFLEGLGIEKFLLSEDDFWEEFSKDKPWAKEQDEQKNEEQKLLSADEIEVKFQEGTLDLSEIARQFDSEDYMTLLMSRGSLEDGQRKELQRLRTIREMFRRRFGFYNPGLSVYPKETYGLLHQVYGTIEPSDLHLEVESSLINFAIKQFASPEGIDDSKVRSKLFDILEDEEWPLPAKRKVGLILNDLVEFFANPKPWAKEVPTKPFPEGYKPFTQRVEVKPTGEATSLLNLQLGEQNRRGRKKVEMMKPGDSLAEPTPTALPTESPLELNKDTGEGAKKLRITQIAEALRQEDLNKAVAYKRFLEINENFDRQYGDARKEVEKIEKSIADENLGPYIKKAQERWSKEQRQLTEERKVSPELLRDLILKYRGAQLEKVQLEAIMQGVDTGKLNEWLGSDQGKKLKTMEGFIQRTNQVLEDRFGFEHGLFREMYDNLGDFTKHDEILIQKAKLIQLAGIYFSNEGNMDPALEGWFNDTAAVYSDNGVSPKIDLYTFVDRFKAGGKGDPENKDIKTALDFLNGKEEISAPVVLARGLPTETPPPLPTESSPVPVTPETASTRMSYGELLRKVKEGSADEQGLVLLYEAFKRDLTNPDSKHNLSKAYQETWRSLENINRGGEAAKMVHYMKALHIMAGLGEYDATVQFEPEDNLGAKRVKITEKLKKDFYELAEKIIEKSLAPAINERIRFLESKDKTTKVLQDKASTRKQIREAAYSHSRAKSNYHGVMNSFAEEIGGFDLYYDSLRFQETDERVSATEPPLREFGDLTDDEKKGWISREHAELTKEIANPVALKILSDIKNDPNEAFKIFESSLTLSRVIDQKEKKLADSVNAPPDYICNLASEIKELRVLHMTEVAKVRLQVAEKRRVIADEVWKNAKGELKGKWFVETIASRVEVVKQRFEAGMFSLKRTGPDEALMGMSTRPGTLVGSAGESRLPTLSELKDLAEQGADARSYLSESLKNLIFIEARPKIAALHSVIRLKEFIKIQGIEAAQHRLDISFQAKLSFIHKLDEIKWRIGQELLALPKGRDGRENLKNHLIKLEKKRDIVKKRRARLDGSKIATYQRNYKYVRQFDDQLFTALGTTPVAKIEGRSEAATATGELLIRSEDSPENLESDGGNEVGMEVEPPTVVVTPHPTAPPPVLEPESDAAVESVLPRSEGREVKSQKPDFLDENIAEHFVAKWLDEKDKDKKKTIYYATSIDKDGLTVRITPINSRGRKIGESQIFRHGSSNEAEKTYNHYISVKPGDKGGVKDNLKVSESGLRFVEDKDRGWVLVPGKRK